MPVILLRIASLMMLLHAIGHTFGIMSWKKSGDNAARRDVIDKMMGSKFPFMGVQRSMGEFYEGFGHAATIAMLLVVALLWVMSGELNNAALAIKIIWPVCIFCLLLGLIELRYFFPFAAAFSIISAILIAISAVVI